jgi:hypothetical protein
MSKSPLAKTLRAIASALENLEPHELDALVAGRGRLVFVSNEQPDKQMPKDMDIQTILGRLNRCENREDAQKVLSEISSRERLATIAKALKVHVVKDDRREDIEKKIISFAIGSKLRTEAIQSLNLRGGGSEPPDEPR